MGACGMVFLRGMVWGSSVVKNILCRGKAEHSREVWRGRMGGMICRSAVEGWIVGRCLFLWGDG